MTLSKNKILSSKMLLDYCYDMKNNSLDFLYKEIDWPYLLYFSDLNGLTGFLWKMIDGIEDFRVPWKVTTKASDWNNKYKYRWIKHQEILKQLEVDEVIEKAPILLKGAALKKTIYKDNPNVRSMGDIDILIDKKEENNIIRYLKENGFWTREGKNGHTAFSNINNERFVIDIHVHDPSKTHRRDEVYETFTENSHYLDENSMYMLPNNVLMTVYLCKHFCEHETDFRKVLHQDDIKLIRLIDIVYLLNEVNNTEVIELAHVLGWEKYLYRVIWYIESLFEIKTSFFTHSSYEINHIVTPVGTYHWEESFSKRALAINRAEWLGNKMGDWGRRSYWYTAKDGNTTPKNFH